jgi:hypothetical protein
LVGYMTITRDEYFQDNLFTTNLPTLFFAFISYVIGGCFMNVYGTAAEAIVHCYCMDEEINQRKVKYAPSLLQEFVDGYVN